MKVAPEVGAADQKPAGDGHILPMERAGGAPSGAAAAAPVRGDGKARDSALASAVLGAMAGAPGTSLAALRVLSKNHGESEMSLNPEEAARKAAGIMRRRASVSIRPGVCRPTICFFCEISLTASLTPLTHARRPCAFKPSGHLPQGSNTSRVSRPQRRMTRPRGMQRPAPAAGKTGQRRPRSRRPNSLPQTSL